MNFEKQTKIIKKKDIHGSIFSHSNNIFRPLGIVQGGKYERMVTDSLGNILI